jgi:Fe-S-cluster-containing dehydrogenase component
MPKHGHRWIDILQREKGQCPMVEVVYLPITCNHCDDAPCIKAARDGAVKKRADGIVIIDPEKAQGQRQLVDACPYGAIWCNEAKQLPLAWPFDAHLLDAGWTKTRGAQVCATRAMRTLHVDDEEMQRIVRDEGLQVLHPEYDTRPRVYYKNLDRFYKAFIGGSLAGEIDGVEECVAGARLVLKRGTQTVAETKSDAFGDFKFQALEEESGAYRLEIADERFAPKTIGIALGRSTYLGTISLERRSAVPA